MRFLVNVVDGTITDCAGAMIVDTDHMDNKTYDLYLTMEDDDLVELAKKVGVPVADIPNSFLDNTGETE